MSRSSPTWHLLVRNSPSSASVPSAGGVPAASATSSARTSLPAKPNRAPLRFTGHDHNDTILKEHAEVAQLVEQLIRNQQVIGSSPIFGSIPLSSIPARSRRAFRSRDSSQQRFRNWCN